MIIAEVRIQENSEVLEIALPVDATDIILEQYVSRGRLIGFFDMPSMVKDVCRGHLFSSTRATISYTENSEKHPDFRLSAFNDQPADGNTNAVVLILESPHKSEYLKRGCELTPIAPAQGKKPGDAGGAISKYIERIMEDIGSLNPGNYPFLIVNPIPYQTSLFHLLGLTKIDVALRNEVWMRLWKLKPIRDFFIQRLDGYQPKLIINACTTPACCYVTDFLIQTSHRDILFKCMHPSCNWNLGRRGICPASID